MPGAELLSFTGIINATTNMILSRMEEGESFVDAVKYCQSIGLAETDPSGDVDGWDASIKVAALATVLMNTPLKPQEVERKGIGELTFEMVNQAKLDGKRWKLVAFAERVGSKSKRASRPNWSMRPRIIWHEVPPRLTFRTDVLPITR